MASLLGYISFEIGQVLLPAFDGSITLDHIVPGFLGRKDVSHGHRRSSVFLGEIDG